MAATQHPLSQNMQPNDHGVSIAGRCLNAALASMPLSRASFASAMHLRAIERDSPCCLSAVSPS